MRILVKSLRNLYKKYLESGTGNVTEVKITEMFDNGVITASERDYILNGIDEI